jgi:hypothetical protein
MATLAIGLAGAAIGGSIGGTILGVSAASIGFAIGSAIGSVVDRALFTPNVQGPRLDDLSVTTSTYGTNIPLIYGPENRVAGNMIWSSGLLETESTESAKGGPQITTFTYRESFAIALMDRPAEGVIEKVWANGKLIFDIANNTYSLITPSHFPLPDIVVPALDIDPPTPEVGMVCTREHHTHVLFDTIRFYQGNGTQQIDPTIESFIGVGVTPAYRHTCYFVITDLQLADFGNFHPNIEVKFVADTEITYAEIVNDICSRADVGVISSTQITGNVLGFPVARASSCFAALQPLALAGSFDITEQRGQIRCVARGGMLRGVIDAGQMGAAPPGGKRPDPYKFARSNDNELPREVTVNFKDASLDYQLNGQSVRRQFGSAESNIVIDLSMTSTPELARRIADRALWGAWAGRRSTGINTTDHWIRRAPADMIGIQVAGNVLPFKIIRVARGANAISTWDLVYDDPEVYRSEIVGQSAVPMPNFVSYPGATRLVLMDAPLLRDADNNSGFYWVASGIEDGWRGASIMRSTDNGISFALMSMVGIRAIIGDVATALPNGTTISWDDANELIVELDRAAQSLESLSDLEVLNGGNAAWLGRIDGHEGEIIQFGTASLIAARTYRLTHLLRGRRGTEYAVHNHSNNEVFVLLQGGSLGRSDFTSTDWNKNRVFKPVSVLTTEADTVAQNFLNTGEALRCFSPVNFSGSRDGSNNLTISWVRRTRLFTTGLGGGPVPLGEESESYEIDIHIGSTIVIRTLTSTSPSIVYTAAEQTADGITPGNPVNGEGFQMSATTGRGHGQEFIV